MDRMFNEMIIKSPQRTEKKKRRRQTELNGVLRGKIGRRFKTDTTVLLGNSRQPALATKVSMLGSVSTTETFSEALAARKNPMDAAHKSPCVICLGTFVTSAGACDFIALAFYFSHLAGFEAQHSPWPSLEEPER